MNELLAGIYGTGGFEKVAHEDGRATTLSDLAFTFASEAVGDGDHEKIASAQSDIFEHLVSFDRAGRAIAQNEFSQMEKAAHEGDPSALEAFFEDVATPDVQDDTSDVRSAILAEIERRLA